MAIHIIAGLVSKTVSSQYYIPFVVGLLAFYYVRGWTSGKKTDRERDLHGRTVLLTGASTAIGITLIPELARRGAQIIAVVPDLSDPAILSLMDLVRVTTNNELVFAEQCDLTSPKAITDFCAQLVKSSGGGLESDPPRIDAVIFAHEYTHIGAFRGSKAEKEKESAIRLQGRLASFFFTTLLLPVFLTAPQDRDIRFINLVSPFYGAAIPSYDPKAAQDETPTTSIWIEEGRRSLKTILFTRHFQRILDALPSTSVQTRMINLDGYSSPATVKVNNVDNQPEAVAAKRPSNIIVTAVSPGISRWDTIAPFMRADRNSPFYSFFGTLCYFAIIPLLYLIAKSSDAAVQSVLHALFLPSSIKVAPTPQLPPGSAAVASETKIKPEYVRGGALYAECEPVHFPAASEQHFGGEEGGQRVWEHLERELAKWRKTEDVLPADGKEGSKR